MDYSLLAFRWLGRWLRDLTLIALLTGDSLVLRDSWKLCAVCCRGVDLLFVLFPNVSDVAIVYLSARYILLKLVAQ